MGKKQQAAECLFRLETTGTDQTPIEDDILIHSITAYIPQKVEGRAIYMQAHDILNDSDGIGILAVHAIAISTETKHDKRPITAQEFVYKPENGSYCQQASATGGLPRSTFS